MVKVFENGPSKIQIFLAFKVACVVNTKVFFMDRFYYVILIK